MIAPERIREAERLLRLKIPSRKVAALTGLSKQTVQRIWNGRRRPHDSYNGREQDRNCYLPTAEQIAEAAAAIQAEWSKDEEYRRCVTKPQPVEIPVAYGLWPGAYSR